MQRDYAYDEASLLRLLAEDSEYAFGVVFDRYRPKVYNLALKFLKSPALAEEVVQEVFLRIWLKRSELEEIQSFDSYLFISARNATFDAFRKLSNKAVAEAEYAATRDVVDEGIDYGMLEEQYQVMLQETVALLPAQQARVFHLAKVDGLSHEAIADQMNISKLTVKKHMANALQFIRLRLHQHMVTLMPVLFIIFG
jgi:RNA polymerase sigma-70 factor (family 1)